jgi:hypothetical protein
MNAPVKKKSGLGRGLSALLENADTDVTSRELRPLGSISQIPLNEVEANPFQPRTDFKQEELEESLSFLNNKKVKTKQDKESIEIIKSILKNMK